MPDTLTKGSTPYVITHATKDPAFSIYGAVHTPEAPESPWELADVTETQFIGQSSSSSPLAVDNDSYSQFSTLQKDPNWDTPLSIIDPSTGRLDGQAPNPLQDASYTFTFDAVSKAAGGVRNAAFKIAVTTNPLIVCGDACKIRFDTATDNGSTAPNGIDISALLGPGDYELDPDASKGINYIPANWQLKTIGGTTYLFRQAQTPGPDGKGTAISAVELGVNNGLVKVPVRHVGQTTDQIVPAAVLPDPNLIYSYANSKPAAIRLRVIDDPQGTSYANDPQLNEANNQPLSIDLSKIGINTPKGTPGCTDNGELGCSVAEDDEYQFNAGTLPSYVRADSTVDKQFNFVYGTLTKANNWTKTLTDFIPKASSRANGKALVNIQYLPDIIASDLEIVPRKSPAQFQPTSSSCSGGDATHNECLINQGSGGQTSAMTVLPIDISIKPVGGSVAAKTI